MHSFGVRRVEPLCERREEGSALQSHGGEAVERLARMHHCGNIAQARAGVRTFLLVLGG